MKYDRLIQYRLLYVWYIIKYKVFPGGYQTVNALKKYPLKNKL